MRFALQDEITKKVVAAIEPRLLEAEGIRSQSRSADDIGAWDMVMRANSLFWRLTKTEGEAAIVMLKKAVAVYPDYAPAQSMLAFAMLVARLFGWTVVAPPVKEAAALAKRAAYRRCEAGVPTRYRLKPELRRCLWLSRLGAGGSGP